MYWWYIIFFFFFKQKTAYEMRISDWSSDVCSSDLRLPSPGRTSGNHAPYRVAASASEACSASCRIAAAPSWFPKRQGRNSASEVLRSAERSPRPCCRVARHARGWPRSEEHTSELQSLMRNSYAVFCLKKKKHSNTRMQTLTNIQIDYTYIN